jgi:hypothetical protein
MMQVYREGARRILTAQKKLSTILITQHSRTTLCRVAELSISVDSKADGPESALSNDWQNGLVEKLRMEVDNEAASGEERHNPKWLVRFGGK